MKFTDREIKLIENCTQYSHNNPAGLPGHNLMIIVAKLFYILNMNGIDLDVDE